MGQWGQARTFRREVEGTTEAIQVMPHVHTDIAFNPIGVGDTIDVLVLLNADCMADRAHAWIEALREVWLGRTYEDWVRDAVADANADT